MAAQEGAGHPLRWRYGDVDDSNFAVHGRGIPLLVGLLFLVVLFVVLCLYLRWARSRNRPREAISSSSSSVAAPPSIPGLDADAIGGLPVTLYRPAAETPAAAGEGGEAAQCSICISALVEGEKVKALPPCGHCFHPECVDAWLRSQPSCPLCRSFLAAAARPRVGTDTV